MITAEIPLFSCRPAAIGSACRCLVTGFLVAVLFCLVPGAASARTVSVGVYENPPKVFTDPSGAPAGIFIDLIEYMAEEEGWQLQYVPVLWGEGLDLIEQGRLDLMPDVAYTAEREARFAYHRESALSDWFQVYARKNSGITSIVDLAGKRVAVLDQSVQQAAFRRLISGFELDIQLVSLPDYSTMFVWVAEGEADAAITNRFYGVGQARTYNLEDTAIIFSPTRLFFAAPRQGRQQLLDAIDKHLLQIKRTPQSVYHETLQRWTSEPHTLTVPDWVKFSALMAGLVLVLSFLGSYVLKRQVDARTRELQQINREMEQRIRERTADLAAAMIKAQEADRLKSTFLATMSHELRTPLNSIIGFTGILLQKLAGPINEEQQKQLGMVQTSARHLLALISEILDISKIEAGQLELSRETFVLKESIDKVVALVTPQAQKAGIGLQVEMAAGDDRVTTDQRRLEQIILNLLTNAVKFTEQGQVRLRCWRQQEQYVVAVEDTGIGISEEALPGLFQPFHQLDSGLSRKREGTGLGLAISKKLIEMLGGSIDVQSRPGVGSTFTIRFPETPGAMP